jgi:hypothetical protein
MKESYEKATQRTQRKCKHMYQIIFASKAFTDCSGGCRRHGRLSCCCGSEDPGSNHEKLICATPRTEYPVWTIKWLKNASQ